jgi:GNAT superfamily N-acetyltransferase
VRAGYSVVGESWGARLRLAEPPELSRAVAARADARSLGYLVDELDPSWAAEVTRLEALTRDDYPVTPATPAVRRSESEMLAWWATGSRFFGAAVGDRLVAVTAISPREGRGETEFTSVDAAHRRRGLAVAVKAASIIALAEDGIRVFGTGGAAVNEASIRMNESLGYVIEERWLSFAPPPPA